ncbi:trigger factor-like isoform X2 [Neocloeon triangulifer]|uniref:trigger factor-like isoform X2 n=1 Tax=Neocloeon triangulifer TaxID=2078957 RepID=UPI00286F3A4A|nr:trigger factor-like isoform X2 [Neocloeon triangulifer]
MGSKAMLIFKLAFLVSTGIPMYDAQSQGMVKLPEWALEIGGHKEPDPNNIKGVDEAADVLEQDDDDEEEADDDDDSEKMDDDDDEDEDEKTDSDAGHAIRRRSVENVQPASVANAAEKPSKDDGDDDDDDEEDDDDEDSEKSDEDEEEDDDETTEKSSHSIRRRSVENKEVEDEIFEDDSRPLPPLLAEVDEPQEYGLEDLLGEDFVELESESGEHNIKDGIARRLDLNYGLPAFKMPGRLTDPNVHSDEILADNKTADSKKTILA